jgi:hypothetical protein
VVVRVLALIVVQHLRGVVCERAKDQDEDHYRPSEDRLESLLILCFRWNSLPRGLRFILLAAFRFFHEYLLGNNT